MPVSNKARTAREYAVAVVLSVIALVWVMKLWDAELNIPFLYSSDSLAHGFLIKGMIDNGWYFHNELVGAPGGYHKYDFPASDELHFLLMKVISFFVSSYAGVINLYYLLSFPLTTISSLYVFRHFKISFGPSLVGSLLFTFLPYHFFRGEIHLLLAAYFMIPLMAMVLLWVALDQFLFFEAFGEKPGLRFNIKRFKPIVSIIVCVCAACSGVYYAFFSCFFLFVSGILSSIRKRKKLYLCNAIILVIVIFIPFIASISPNLVYHYNHGGNPSVANRLPAETELYGLKIAQLVLPVSEHRISYLADLKERYNCAPLVNENDWSSLGFVGSIGFLISIGWIFFRENGEKNPLTTYLSYFNLSAILLSTVGGLGSIFALMVSPQIRALNRISIFIAFFSLFTVVILLEKIYEKCNKSWSKLVLFNIFLGILLIAGILDQTTHRFVPLYSELKREFSQDAEFIKKIEKILPDKSMVFQLPYSAYWETRPLYKMENYELFKAYLHSKKLRWSYGAMKGREGDLWQKTVAELPLEEFLSAISFAGFGGIYLNRYGYADMGADMIEKLSYLLNEKPLVSAGKRQVFFDMTGFNNELKGNLTEIEFGRKKKMALHPQLLSWRGGFSELEGTSHHNWRWCSNDGELTIYNNQDKTINIRLEMVFASGYEELSDLKIESKLFSERLQINAKGLPFQKNLTVPPGQYVIKFSSEAKRTNAHCDPRVLVFKVINFKMSYLQ